MKYVLMFLGAIAGFFLLMGVSLFGVEWQGFLNKKIEQNRYEVTKESAAYRDGMQRNLASLMNDYNKTDGAGKVGIQMTVKHQYSQTDTSDYPEYLQSFLGQMGL